MSDLFLLCRDCQVVHRVYGVHELALGGPASEEAAIAYGQFLVQHRHHPLERVERCGEPTHHDGPLWDPMRPSFMEVSNGREVFTVRTARAAIDQPLSRQIVAHRIERRPVRLTVEEAGIRRALDHHFYPHALRSTKVDHFVRALHDVLAALPGTELEPVFDDGDDPTVSIAPLPDDSCVALLARCLEIFDSWELPRVASFVSANRDEYGALALRIHRDATIHRVDSDGPVGSDG